MKNSIWTLIVALGILIAATVGCKFNLRTYDQTTQNAPETTSPKKEPEIQKEKTNSQLAESSDEPIRSTELIEKFRQDKASANAKYKGKTLLIRGKITDINDVLGTVALSLRDSNDAAGLQCYLSNNNDAEKVAVGQEILVRGKVRGDDTGVIDQAVLIHTGEKSAPDAFSKAYPQEISRNIRR